jgi:hypothetical protein
MSGNHKAPVPASILADDREAIKALAEMPNYTPHRPEHGAAALLSLDAALTETADEISRLQRATEAARVRYVELSWTLHTNVIGARDEVGVLFGPDSAAVSAVGRKRTSERKRPTRRAKPD